MIYLGNSPVGVVTKTDPNVWVKPEDWPDIEALPLPSGNEACIYFLYDCETEVKHAGFSVGGYSTASLSVASYKNGVLSEFDDSTIERSSPNVFVSLPDDCKYAVVKLSNLNNGQFCFATNAAKKMYNTSNNNGSNQPCLWMYGKTYSATAIDLYSNGSGGISTIMLERARLYISPLMSIGYGFAPCPNLKSIIINDGDFENAGRLINSGSCGINGDNIDIVAKNIKSVNGRTFGSRSSKSINIDGLSSTTGSITLGQTFQDNQNVKSISIRTDGLKITSTYYTFSGCRLLKSLDMSGCDMSECTSTGAMFSSCYALEDCYLGDNIVESINLAACVSLSHDSLVNGIIAKLGEVSGKTLTLSNISEAKLSSSELAVATAKGWTVA